MVDTCWNYHLFFRYHHCKLQQKRCVIILPLHWVSGIVLRPVVNASTRRVLVLSAHQRVAINPQCEKTLKDASLHWRSKLMAMSCLEMLLAAAAAILHQKHMGRSLPCLQIWHQWRQCPSWGFSCSIVRDPPYTVELQPTLLCHLDLQNRSLVSETHDMKR